MSDNAPVIRWNCVSPPSLRGILEDVGPTSGSRRTTFPTTRWSLLGPAADPQHPQHRRSLEEVLQIYLPVISAYLVGRKALSRDMACELAQGFVVSWMLPGGGIGRASKDRGRFRGYLLTCLSNHVHDWLRRDAAQRALQATLAQEARSDSREVEPAPDMFDLLWARQVLAETARRMRAYLMEIARPDLWELFDMRVLNPIMRDASPPPYAQLLDRFGFQTATEACSAVLSGKRIYARMLTEVVSEYAGADADVEGEINDLWRILAQAPPRSDVELRNSGWEP